MAEILDIQLELGTILDLTKNNPGLHIWIGLKYNLYVIPISYNSDLRWSENDLGGNLKLLNCRKSLSTNGHCWWGTVFESESLFFVDASASC